MQVSDAEMQSAPTGKLNSPTEVQESAAERDGVHDASAEVVGKKTGSRGGAGCSINTGFTRFPMVRTNVDTVFADRTAPEGPTGLRTI